MDTDKQAPYRNYGGLIHAWRNEIKFTLVMVSEDTGIAKDRLVDLESGCEKPSWEELEKLAKEFSVSVRDLLPYEDDRQEGVVILENRDARKFDQSRNDALQYTYTCKAMSSGLPNFKPVELLLHLTDKSKVVSNRGHFFHQFTQVLDDGAVGFVWEWKGKKLYREFGKGDSWLIPGFIPHGFWSPDPKNLGKVLAITFGQHLASGDSRQELSLISPENASRIICDKKDYYDR
jgi:transcriptional regulator with XRE-family HTH domain